VKLSKFLREELEHYRDHNADVAEQNRNDPDEDDGSDFEAASKVFAAMLEGRELTEAEREILREELRDITDRYDDMPEQRREWQELEAHYGLLEVFNAKTEYYPAPYTRVINGVRYITGYRRRH
jgi:hypothetical protein